LAASQSSHFAHEGVVGGAARRAGLARRPRPAVRSAAGAPRAAQPGRQHHRALQEQADIALVGVGDAAVQLHAALEHLQRRVRTAGLDLAGDERALRRAGRRVEPLRRLAQHRARHLHLHQQVDGPMLHGLERAHRLVELLAQLDVVDRELESPRHQPDQFGADRQAGFVEHLFDERLDGGPAGHDGSGADGHA
jgi:hypothetical protein